jgi:hypothetical protein
MKEALMQRHTIEEPFSERKNIARTAAKQAIEWVLGEAESPLTYRANWN